MKASPVHSSTRSCSRGASSWPPDSRAAGHPLHRKFRLAGTSCRQIPAINHHTAHSSCQRSRGHLLATDSANCRSCSQRPLLYISIAVSTKHRTGNTQRLGAANQASSSAWTNLRSWASSAALSCNVKDNRSGYGTLAMRHMAKLCSTA